MRSRSGNLVPWVIVLGTALVSSLLLVAALRPSSPGPQGNQDRDHRGSMVYRPTRVAVKRDHQLELRNTDTCTPTTVTVTKTAVSTFTTTTTVTAAGGGGGGAATSGGTTSGGATTSSACSCPHTTTIPFEGNLPTPRAHPYPKRQAAGCTCTVIAQRPANTGTGANTSGTGTSAGAFEGNLPTSSAGGGDATSTAGGGATAGGPTTGGGTTGSGTTGSGATGELSGWYAMVTATDSAGSTIVTRSQLGAPTTTGSGGTIGAGATGGVLVLTTVNSAGSTVVTTTSLAGASTSGTAGRNYNNAPGSDMPVRPTQGPKAYEGKPFKVHRSKHVGLWDPKLKDNKGGFNTEVLSVDYTLGPDDPVFMFMSTYEKTNSWASEHELSVRRCDVWGKPPDNGFEVELIPDAPFIKIRGTAPEVIVGCNELCTRRDLTIDVPSAMAFKVDTPYAFVNGPSTSHKESRLCNYEDKPSNFSLQTFPIGQDSTTAFPDKDIRCTIEGHLLSTDTATLKLQPQSPWSSIDSTGANPVKVTCREGPTQCSTSDGKRDIKLESGEHTRISIEEADKVGDSPLNVNGKGSTLVRRGCYPDGTKVSLKIYKFNVRPQDMEAGTPPLKTFKCWITGYPFQTTSGAAKVSFYDHFPLYQIAGDDNIWVKCEQET